MVERTVTYHPSESRMFTTDLAHSGSYPFSVSGDGTYYPDTMGGVLPGGTFPDLLVHCVVSFIIHSPIEETYPHWILYMDERIGTSWNIVHTEYSQEWGLQAPAFHSNEEVYKRLLDTYGDSSTRFTLPIEGTHIYRMRLEIYSETAHESFEIIPDFVFSVKCVPRDSLYDVILTGLDFIQDIEFGEEVNQIVRIFNNYPGRVYYTVRVWEEGGDFEFIEGKDPVQYPGEYRIVGAHDSVTISVPYMCSSPDVQALCASANMIRPV